MAAFDEQPEILRRAVAARRSRIADRLIAPGSVVRMFENGQQLEMRKTQLPGVGRELLGQLTIAQPAVVLPAPPGTQMHFVDGNRRTLPVPLRPAGQPVFIAPGMAV